MWEKGKKKKILVIDDEEDFTELVKMNLEETGMYEVRAENKAEVGINVAGIFNPDLILLDIAMPDMEGSEVARQIKNNEKTKHIPIVFLTGVAAKGETKLNRGVIGGYPFVAKPVSLRELIERIEENIE